MVSDHKGLNLPGVAVSVPALTEKDADDLRWALRTRAPTWSPCPSSAAPTTPTTSAAIMDEEGARLPVIAKIEKPQAVEHLEEIVDAFDGIMVARGDLGVEMPAGAGAASCRSAPSSWPGEKARPVIVATQMLESMINAPRPTRAEASDVANAVLDGADAVMLSGETSVGEYPVETVQTMAESSWRPRRRHPGATDSRRPRTRRPSAAPSPGRPPRSAALVGAKALVAFTMTGETARRPVPLPVADPAARLHHPAGDPQPARPDLGRGDVPRARRSHTPTRWCARSSGAARHRPLPEGRPWS